MRSLAVQDDHSHDLDQLVGLKRVQLINATRGTGSRKFRENSGTRSARSDPDPVVHNAVGSTRRSRPGARHRPWACRCTARWPPPAVAALAPDLNRRSDAQPDLSLVRGRVRIGVADRSRNSGHRGPSFEVLGRRRGSNCPQAGYNLDQASASTDRRICSISSKCCWSQISGGRAGRPGRRGRRRGSTGRRRTAPWTENRVAAAQTRPRQRSPWWPCP